MAFPKLVKPFTASFYDVGLSTERLRIFWTYPLGVPNEFYFTVGTQCFLEDPTSSSSLSLVPDEQLLSALGMNAILAGEVLPGTSEFYDAVQTQEDKYFQTIVGDVRLKAKTASVNNPTLVQDLTYGQEGTVFDVTFQRGTSSTNIKTVRTDAWTISQYSNRVDSAAHSVYNVPGAIHKILNLKKSQLGAADSANRKAVIDFVAAQPFWV